MWNSSNEAQVLALALSVFARLALLGAFYPIAAVASTAVWIPTHRMAVDYGLVTRGDLQSLAAVDGNRLVVNRFQVPNLAVAPVTLRLQSNIPFVPSSFMLRVTAQTTQRGPFVLMLDLFDWTMNRYEPFSLSQVALGTNPLTLPCPAPPPVSRFVRAGDRLVLARTRVTATGPVALMSWSAEFDCAGFSAQR